MRQLIGETLLSGPAARRPAQGDPGVLTCLDEVPPSWHRWRAPPRAGTPAGGEHRSLL